MFRKVMVVNDDEISLFVASRMISKTGLAGDVITARHGQNALQVFDNLVLNAAASHEVPELVFLDLHMPVMDGWEFMEAFTNKYAYVFPNIRFVILSSSVHPADGYRLKQYPMVMDHISNPLSFEILLRMKEKFASMNFSFPALQTISAGKEQLIA
jgi:CheY-like chemotaxis protein